MTPGLDGIRQELEFILREYCQPVRAPIPSNFLNQIRGTIGRTIDDRSNVANCRMRRVVEGRGYWRVIPIRAEVHYPDRSVIGKVTH